jgi:predicted CoA-substrate-specific enzyme activase
MITTGIDVGNRTTKAVIIKEGKIVSWSTANTIGDINSLANSVVNQAADKAKVARSSIQFIVSTGAGRKDVKFADSDITEITCVARAAYELFSSVEEVIDVGAEECRVLRTDSKGNVIDFFLNDKCAAGVGMFIEIMAKALNITLEEVSTLSLQSSVDLPLSTSCVVFAESEVISLVNSGAKKSDVLRAVNTAAAMKALALLRRLGAASAPVFVGGVALNRGFIHILNDMLGTSVRTPENPLIVAAMGAALLAQTHVRK